MKNLNSKKIALTGIFATLLIGIGYSTQASAAPCPQGHCGKVNTVINQSCIDLGLAGKPFPVIGPNGDVCTCPCSCVIEGTDISTPSGDVKIEDLKIGDVVTKPYGNESATEITHQLKTQLREPHPVRKIEYNNRSIIVSSNHPFITADHKIIPADQVSVGTLLLDQDGKPVQVTSNRETTHAGSLHNLIINPTSDSSLDHVIITNGIQSGDFLTQSTLDELEMEMDLRLGKIKPISLK